MADVHHIHHHDPYFPHNNTPAINTPVQAFGGIDLTGEITAAAQSTYVNIFDWPLIAVMTLQLSETDLPQSPQSNVSSPQQQQQQSRQQFNEIEAVAHHYTHDNSVQHSSMLQPSPPFVEPSSNYIAIPNQSLPYGFPSTTLPNTTQSITLDNNGNIGTNYSSHNAYMGNSSQQQQQHHNVISNYNFNPNNPLNQREIYQTPIPTSSHHKSVQRSINSIPSNYTRQDVATSLPISIAPNLFMPSFNNQASNGSTMMVPMFDQSTIFTTKSVPTSISINPTESSSSTSPTKQTYSYSGPPKSYYSRLPLYDRPYKCDQCPQSFNRNHDLKRHKRIHLAVKPYPCPHCEKQFSRKDALKRHILVKGCNNSKKSTSPNSSKNVKSTTNSSISMKSIEGGSPIKTEPSDNNGYGMSI